MKTINTGCYEFNSNSNIPSIPNVKSRKPLLPDQYIKEYGTNEKGSYYKLVTGRGRPKTVYVELF